MSSVDTIAYGATQFNYWDQILDVESGPKSGATLGAWGQFDGKVDLIFQAWIKKTGSTAQTLSINAQDIGKSENDDLVEITESQSGHWDVLRYLTFDLTQGSVSIQVTQGSQFNTYSAIRSRLMRNISGVQFCAYNP